MIDNEEIFHDLDGDNEVLVENVSDEREVCMVERLMPSSK